MPFTDSIWQDCPDNGRSTGVNITFYQGGKIGHIKHIPVPVSKSCAKSKYNAACTAGMDLAHFRMLIHEFFNKDPDIVPEEYHLIVLYSKPSMCVAKNGKDTKHTRHIARRIHLISDEEECKMHKIDWCEVGLQLSGNCTKNVS